MDPLRGEQSENQSLRAMEFFGTSRATFGMKESGRMIDLTDWEKKLIQMVLHMKEVSNMEKNMEVMGSIYGIIKRNTKAHLLMDIWKEKEL